jgi:hypothetical protein
LHPVTLTSSMIDDRWSLLRAEVCERENSLPERQGLETI